MINNDKEKNALEQGKMMEGKGPLISVIMSVYNGADTLMEALESISTQTYPNWELVVCDDASTDSTLEILRSFSKGVEPGRIKIIENKANLRLAASLNKCLESATGEFIARMDADDRSAPDRFEKQIEYLLKNPDVDLVGTSMRRFNDEGPGVIIYPAASEPDRYTLANSITPPFCHATILAKRSVFDRIKNYTVAWRTERGQDLDLWFKFFAEGLVGINLPEALYWVREDEKAIRRRTPKARFGAFVTRMKGNIALNYPPRAYLITVIGLLKIFVPYRVFDWQRQRAQRKAQG